MLLTKGLHSIKWKVTHLLIKQDLDGIRNIFHCCLAPIDRSVLHWLSDTKIVFQFKPRSSRN